MFEVTQKNELFIALLLNERLPMQDLLLKIGGRQVLLDTITDLNRKYRGIMEISVSGDPEEVLLTVQNEDLFYAKLQEEKDQDFNDVKFRMAFLLHELLKVDAYLNINDLAETMNVSRGTVNNDVKKLKKTLEKYSCRIIGVPNKGIHFEGEEFHKRLVLLYEVFDFMPLARTVDRTFVEEVREVAVHYGLSSMNMRLLYKASLIAAERVRKGFNLTGSIPMYKNFELGSERLSTLIRLLEERSGYPFTCEETDFISFPVNTRNSAYLDASDNSENEEILRQIVHKMIEQVRRRFMIHVDEEDFFSKVRYHLLFLINRLIFRIPLQDIFSDQIKIRFPLAFELARISMGVLQAEYGLPGNYVDTSYLAVYYALILDERKKPSEVRKGRKHVAVVTNRGRGTFELIRRQLQEIIGEESQVDALSLLDLTKKDISKYHILFSTENILTDVHLPVIAIDGIIDEEALTRKIHELEERRLGYLEQRLSEMYLEIRDLPEKKSYREQVADISEGLRKRGYASDRIYDLFLQKESVSSMIYENGVAFPHLTDPKATKMSLVLGVPENRKDKIQLIFFLVIPETLVKEEEELLMEIYDEIFRIVSDKEQVRKLQQVESITEFIGLLMKGK